MDEKLIGELINTYSLSRALAERLYLTLDESTMSREQLLVKILSEIKDTISELRKIQKEQYGY